MPKLIFKDITIQNFRSFGDYPTKIKLEGLGPVLVLGQIDSTDKSNGSGKSTIADAITWCLFGRLPSKDRPADNIINYFTGGECRVSITTADGYVIARTRVPGGGGDLLIHAPTGEDISDSTNTNAQQHLYKLFNLDYDIFTSSVFFGQFNKPFLELPDQKRKKALERMLGLDRFDHYSDVAKEKVAASELEQTKHESNLANADQEVLRISRQIESNNDEYNNFETSRKTKIDLTKKELNEVDGRFAEKYLKNQELQKKLLIELEQIQLYDLDKLRKEWENYQEELEKLSGEETKLSAIRDVISRLGSEREVLETQEEGPSLDSKLATLNAELTSAKKELSEIIIPDLIAVRASWEKYKTDSENIDSVNSVIRAVDDELIKLRANQEAIAADLLEWQKKAGKTCPTCKQEVSDSHIKGMTNPALAQQAEVVKQIAKKEAERQNLDKALQKLKLKLQKPEMTENEAKLVAENHKVKKATIDSLTSTIQDLVKQKERQESETRKRKDRIKNIILEEKSSTQLLETKTAKLAKKKQALEQVKPTVTLNEAELVKKQYDAKNTEINNAKSASSDLDDQKEAMKQSIREKISEIELGENPYKKIISGLEIELATARKNKTKAAKVVEQFNTLISHIEYIRSAYTDRKKIKAHMLSSLIPYFNERIAYYLDAFECGFSIEFNTFLQTKSDKWPYEMWSGGEKKRIDLALMFAIHDLHSSIYDQQCNLMVLDEVDGRLDGDGISALVSLLFKDFVPTGKTILVISHKNEMRDAFPTKILVKKVNDFSTIEEIR